MKKYTVIAKEIHSSKYEVVAETAQEAKAKVLRGEGDPSPSHDDFDPVFIEPEDLWKNGNQIDKVLTWDIIPFAPITLHGTSYKK